jgi:hypothetical protein
VASGVCKHPLAACQKVILPQWQPYVSKIVLKCMISDRVKSVRFWSKNTGFWVKKSPCPCFHGTGPVLLYPSEFWFRPLQKNLIGPFFLVFLRPTNPTLNSTPNQLLKSYLDHWYPINHALSNPRLSWINTIQTLLFLLPIAFFLYWKKMEHFTVSQCHSLQ